MSSRSQVIHVFRRDMRLTDNTALNEAWRRGHAVLPVFIVDPLLLSRWQRADKRLAFLFQSLASLSEDIRQAGGKLLIRTGDPAEVLGDLLGSGEFSAVFVNREYTPFGRRRDQALADVCESAGVDFFAPDDGVLNPPLAVEKNGGGPYTVFTPYFRKACALPVAAPSSEPVGEWITGEGQGVEGIEEIAAPLALKLGVEVGRGGAEKAMARAATLQDYNDYRDIPAAERTSRLSAHLRFGTCSTRECYQAITESLGRDHPLIRQLYWRDFYTQIGWHFPHVYSGAFRREYDRVKWRSSEEDLAAWKAGRTGFPIVDAGMRELMATGFMHNRVRMIAASLLTKNLRIHWREGEAHFARHLIDYDPAVNNGNWQWGASTGCDAQPYFRVFNPWRQQQKFDRDCVYIRQWIPELRPYPPAAIHGLETASENFYLPGIVDLKAGAEQSKAAFKAASAG